MSKPMKKSSKIALIVLVVLVLLGICFTTVGLYAKNEINKPRFSLPEQPLQPSVTPLPADAAQGAAYIERLFQATRADDVETTWYTDVNLGGDAQLPFADADNALLLFIRDQAAGQIAALYPSLTDAVTLAVDAAPRLPLDAPVIEFTAEQGRTDDAGNVTEDDFYFITLTLDPASIDTQAMTTGEVYQGITEILAPAASMDEIHLEATNLTVSAKIDRVTDQLLTVDVTRTFEAQAALTLTDAYAALAAEKTANVTLPYETTEHFSFRHYGARFTERAMAVTPGDMKALPAAVTVNAAATKEDYKLTFDVSQPETMTIDADGVMNVLQASDKPVTITMTLDYDGHSYTDQLLVYITELEVETTNA